MTLLQAPIGPGTPGSAAIGRHLRLLRVRVRPGGRSDRPVAAHGGALEVEVTAAPERGKANAAVEVLLARALEVPRA